MTLKVVQTDGQTTIDGQDIGKIRSVNLIDPRGKVLATDRSYVGQVEAAAEELQTTWQFHHLDGSLFTESETWKPQDFSFGGWQPAIMDSGYATTTRDKSLHQWNGVGRENQFWSTFRSDYAHYLTNPSEMDGGLRTGFYLSAAASSATLLVAGGLVLAGATATAGVSALATGGAMGVIVGGGTSAVQGRDVASGALVGAASGMVGGYASSLLSGSLGTSLVMQGFVGSAADGAVYEALQGGSLSDIAISATINGTLGAATGGLLRGAQQGIAKYAKPLYSKAVGTVFVAPRLGAFGVGGRILDDVGFYSLAKLERLKAWLATKGVRLDTDADDFLNDLGIQNRTFVRGHFEVIDEDLVILSLRSNPTRYEVLHELSHALDYLKNPELWKSGSSIAWRQGMQETAVFNRLFRSRQWVTLSLKERLDAYKYAKEMARRGRVVESAPWRNIYSQAPPRPTDINLR